MQTNSEFIIDGRHQMFSVGWSTYFEYEFDCRTREQTNSQIASRCSELLGIFGLCSLSFIFSSRLATCQLYFCSPFLMRIYLLEFIFLCLTSCWWLINKFKLYYNVNNVSSLIFTIFRTRHHNGRSIVIIIHVNIYLNGNLGDTLIVFLSSRLIISPESATPSPDHTRSLVCLGVMNLTAITSI